jgi:hypothetical protein
MLYEEHLLVLGNSGHLLSLLDLFYILELDKEWSVFCQIRKQVLLSLNSTSLKEYILAKVNCITELKLIILPILLDLSSTSKGKQSCPEIIDRILRPTDLSPAMSHLWLESNNKLKEELENFVKKKTAKHIDLEQIEQLAARLAGDDPSKVTSEDLQSLIFSSPQILLAANKILQQEVKIKTSPVSFEAKSQQMDIYHDLYPVKRMQSVSLKNLTDDIFIKLLLAQKAELIKTVYSCYEHNDPQKYMPEAVVAALHKVHPNIDTSVRANLGDCSLLITILESCMASKAYMRGQLSVIGQLYRQMVEDCPTTSLPGLRDCIAFGVKVQANVKSKSLYIAVVYGANLLERKCIRLENEDEFGSSTIDLDFEEEFNSLLKKYFPKVVSMECNSRLGITLLQRIKEQVAKFVGRKSDLHIPVYITKRTPIPERRACSLDTRPKQGEGIEFLFLIAYSMACMAQDRLLEILKLRFETREFPYLFNESCVGFVHQESSGPLTEVAPLGLPSQEQAFEPSAEPQACR